jgi:anti-sigma-K factor RskA
VSHASTNNGHERWEGDAAAYALRALEQHELGPFEQHLASCAECQRDVAVMQNAVDALAMSAAHVVPETELKQRVISVVREEAQREPAGANALTPPRHKRGRWISWRVPVLAAAVVVLAVVVTALSLGGANSTRTYAGVVNAPGATAAVRVSGGHAQLVFARLPKLPAKLIYEMWLKRGIAAPVPAGALFASSSGAVGVPGGVRGVQEVLVTAEPRPSGTDKPTRAPIIVVRLT